MFLLFVLIGIFLVGGSMAIAHELIENKQIKKRKEYIQLQDQYDKWVQEAAIEVENYLNGNTD